MSELRCVGGFSSYQSQVQPMKHQSLQANGVQLDVFDTDTDHMRGVPFFQAFTCMSLLFAIAGTGSSFFNHATLEYEQGRLSEREQNNMYFFGIFSGVSVLAFNFACTKGRPKGPGPGSGPDSRSPQPNRPSSHMERRQHPTRYLHKPAWAKSYEGLKAGPVDRFLGKAVLGVLGAGLAFLAAPKIALTGLAVGGGSLVFSSN